MSSQALYNVYYGMYMFVSISETTGMSLASICFREALHGDADILQKENHFSHHSGDWIKLQ